MAFHFQCDHQKSRSERASISERQFTSANRKENPTYEKLDRVLASVSREQKFPLILVRALTRAGSSTLRK
jgi:hypothetical protein